MKEKIAKWYRLGLWTKEMVDNAINKGVISLSDAVEILNQKG